MATMIGAIIVDVVTKLFGDAFMLIMLRSMQQTLIEDPLNAKRWPQIGPHVKRVSLESDHNHDPHEGASTSNFPSEMLLRILLASLDQVSGRDPSQVTADVSEP